MHLFEFEDHRNTPTLFRKMLLEILELCNSTFRPYYKRVCGRIIEDAKIIGFSRVIELGAGTAPLSRALAESGEAHGLSVVPCDLMPDVQLYSQLAQEFPGQVHPILEPVDITKEVDWGDTTAVVLCAALHHVPAGDRPRILRALTRSSKRVMIFEPVRNNPVSILLATTSLVPAMLLPLFFLSKPGFFSRALWCWLVPIVPLMFVWDGVVGCLRQWSTKRWASELKNILGSDRQPTIKSNTHSQMVIW